MEMTQLRYFVALAKYQHFTKAAKELYISQPSLSKSISNLENELGVRLFDRDKKAVYLNEYGKSLLQHAEKILLEEAEAKSKVQEMSSGLSGSISIASNFPIEAPGPIYYCVEEFFLSNPGISCHIFLQNEDMLRQMLQSRHIDFSFSNANINIPDSEVTELYTSRVGVVMSTDHPLAMRTDPISIYELKNESFLCTNPLYNIRESVYYICRLANFEPNVVFEGNSSDIVGQAIGRGRGISLTSEEMFNYKSEQEHPSGRGGLVFKHLEEDFCKRTIHVSYLKNRYHPAAMRLFYESLLRKFGKTARDM